MAKMVFQYDIKTPQPNADVDAMVEAIRKGLSEEFQMMEKVDISNLYFGIKSARVQFMCDAADGTLQDKLENYLNGLEETGEMELSFTSRL